MNEKTNRRRMRRLVGHLGVRTDELPLGQVAEPRTGKVKLKMRSALTALITGIAAGCKGLAEVEELSDWMGRGARKRLRIFRRIPDTTMRDLVVKIEPEEMRKLIRHGIAQAHRRKQLSHDLTRARGLHGWQGDVIAAL